MVKLVGAAVVEVFALKVNLGLAQVIGHALAMVNRGGAALELFADTAQLVDELSALGNGGISLVNFFEGVL